MDQDQIISLIQDQLKQRDEDGAYGVTLIPYHTHNGVDSPLITTGVGSGTVTGISIASANGFAGTATSTATPVITLKTSITGILQGNGTAITGITLPADSTQFLNGNGAFAVPASSNSPYTVNADETSLIAFTTQINGPISNTVPNGWTLVSAGSGPSYNAIGSNGFSVTNAGFTGAVANARMGIIAPSSSNLNQLSADTPNVYRLRFYGRARSATANATNRAAVGFSDLTGGSDFYSETATDGRDIKFVFNTNTIVGFPTMYAVCSNATSVTSNNLHLDPTVFHIYEIVVTPYTSAKFYVDGNLVSTITTNLYATGSQLLNLEVGSFVSGSTVDIELYLQSPTFSITL